MRVRARCDTIDVAATVCAVRPLDTERRDLPMQPQNTTVSLIKCACGCGELLAPFDRKGRARTRIRHHNRGSRPHALDHLQDCIVVDENSCWIWQRCRNRLGYGQVSVPGRRTRQNAHRAVYEHLCGPIAEGFELDHLCRVPSCVNPDHMEVVTHAENMARAPWTAIQFQTAKSACPAGHLYTAENTYLNPKGSRECRVCRALRRNRSARRHFFLNKA